MVLGILSLIFWALIVVVSLKYAVLILRADNHGEGGIMALLALLDARRGAAAELARLAADRGPGRSRAALRRRRDHAGDLCAERGRRA